MWQIGGASSANDVQSRPSIVIFAVGFPFHQTDAPSEDEPFANVTFLTAEAGPQSVAALEPSDVRPACLHWQELEASPLEPLLTRRFNSGRRKGR